MIRHMKTNHPVSRRELGVAAMRANRADGTVPRAAPRLVRLFALAVILLGLDPAWAQGTSLAAVPTKVDVVRSEGLMLHGTFGNSGGCTAGNALFVKADHPQYKQIFAMAMTALAAKQKISGYVHGCEAVTWYSTTTTYNIVYSHSTMSVSD